MPPVIFLGQPKTFKSKNLQKFIVFIDIKKTMKNIRISNVLGYL